MTFDDLLTLPLHKRIEGLRRHAGSHDKLAAALGTSRQTIIEWEKGAQPSARYRRALSSYSGLPADEFRRSGVELAVWALTESRLRSLEARLDRVVLETARGFELLGHRQHGLGGQEEDREPGT